MTPPSPTPDLWQPIETAPKDRRFLGGYFHAAYGWLWSPARHHIDPYHPDGYFVMEGGGEPTHWIDVAAAPDPVRLELQACRTCGGSGFVAEKRCIDDGYGEVDSCPTCVRPVQETP